jgi:hypothetical protein
MKTFQCLKHPTTKQIIWWIISGRQSITKLLHTRPSKEFLFPSNKYKFNAKETYKTNQHAKQHSTSFEQIHWHFYLWYHLGMKFHLQLAIRSTRQPEKIYATSFSVLRKFCKFGNCEIMWNMINMIVTYNFLPSL